MHRQQRQALIRQILKVHREDAAGATATVSRSVMHFLKTWLIQHIRGSDRNCQPHIKAKGMQ